VQIGLAAMSHLRQLVGRLDGTVRSRPITDGVSERVIGRWNSLPQHVIDSASINAFKNGLNIMRRDSMGFFMDYVIVITIHQRYRETDGQLSV